MKYRKKPVVIDAWKICDANMQMIRTLVAVHNIGTLYEQWDCESMINRYTLVIHTLEGDMKASNGDYLVKGVKGEFYAVKEDIFKQTYEVVEEYRQ